MEISKKIVDTARGYIGTPWEHQGRHKVLGVDCIGLLICVAHEVFGIFHDVSDYDRMPDGTLLKMLDTYLDRIPFSEARIGDVVAMKFDDQPHHVAILGDYLYGGFSIIHSFARSGKVIETRLTPEFQNLIVAYYRIKRVLE